MKGNSGSRWGLLCLLLGLVLVVPGLASAQTSFTRIVVFGDSLSDPGNAFAFLKTAATPPYDTLDQFLIPPEPYAKGGHHFSNGKTWIELLAAPLGLAGTTRPAFQGSGTEATNYATGAARAYQETTNLDFGAQTAAFLNDFDGVAPPDALYVIEFGGNDLRDAVAAGAGAGAIIEASLTSLGENIAVLYHAGARKFLVWNAPDIALTPAIRTLDTLNPGARAFADLLTATYNAELAGVLGSLAVLPGIEIVPYDLFGRVTDIVAAPEKYGLTVVDRPCVTPNVPPYFCRTPDQFFFWDGIHPTEAVHRIIAGDAAAVLAQ